MKNNLKIYFNNIKNPFLKKRISKIFSCALNENLANLEIRNKIETGSCLFEVDIKFVREDEIRKLNKKFRKIDKQTDVLSFPLTDFENLENYNMLGDIIVCKRIAKLQAKKFEHSLNRELCFLALHGFLHLLGYDHIKKIDEEIMNKKSEVILNKYKVKR